MNNVGIASCLHFEFRILNSEGVFHIDRSALGVEVECQRSLLAHPEARLLRASERQLVLDARGWQVDGDETRFDAVHELVDCLLYTSDAADERSSVDLGGR